jgi:hypothetical protein
MKVLTRKIAAIALGLFLTMSAQAGPYADDMGRCLVRETGQAERTAIMKWLFAAMALHPEVQSMSTIDAAAREAINRDVGTLFQRLLVESCRSESSLAIKNEGALALQSAFSVLGQVAMRELMANPDVNAGLGELEKYVDQKRIEELGTAEPAPAQ